MMPKRRRHDPIARLTAGFTLLELVAVMTLLTIMLALVGPQLSGFFRGRELNEETRRISALTRFARSEAIARSERMLLWLAPARNEYGLRGLGPEREGAPTPRTYALGERFGLQLPEDTALNEQQEAELIFSPDGTLDEAGPTQFDVLEEGVPVRRFSLTPNRLEFVAAEVTDDAS